MFKDILLEELLDSKIARASLPRIFACTCLKMNVMVKYRNIFKNWLTIGMHKNVAVPMRLAKRHDLTKSQISIQIYQNHATRHDLVHSLYLFISFTATLPVHHQHPRAIGSFQNLRFFHILDIDRSHTWRQTFHMCGRSSHQKLRCT